ncbi:hypothetical protein CROQUDRAFT_40536 [Cronartium quercuum f. sp. fusiforme G11]|uniref:General transcription and DNA repair factor IIH n=1 Tax=Cronartium quercuum f. sp. fusiforme G11 TaxID=708437 RepID=A0A9P6NRT8_9BASI|nr:hypothetical protein CROQUDRAFT_40536 [Cronartium quercuum f. sp. fusiforme G11]
MPTADSESDDDHSDYQPTTKDSKGKQKQTVAKPKLKKKATAYASKDGQGYAWEEEYKRSWDVVREDDSGSLEGAVNQLMANKRKRVIRDTTTIQRGIIRHLCLVIDLSLAMTDRDLRPTRLEMSLNYAQEFVTEFFDQNPISQMCILTTKDAIAERLSPLSGNPVDHHKALSNKRKLEPSGEPSLQNALEMARASLAHLPPHGSKETLVIMGSLTTCDPEDIHKTIENLEKDRMRVSIVGLSAEVNICKEICRRTQGKYGVIMNETHFKELLFDSIPPPPTLAGATTTAAASAVSAAPTRTAASTAADLMQMGFPTKLSNPIPSLCACHSQLRSSGFICPRCGSKLCDVPTDCVICGLTVVSSPHLARSYRHLFPVANWKEVTRTELSSKETSSCFGCAKVFHKASTTTSQPKYVCDRCTSVFCSDCDLFHEQLGLCPGCCT